MSRERRSGPPAVRRGAARRIVPVILFLALPLAAAAPALDAPVPAPMSAPTPAPTPPIAAHPASPAAPVRPRVQQVPPNRVIAVLGQQVLGPNGKEVGRLVDVLVNAAGVPEAAVIDFGGFMGVGSRTIAVRWNTLRFHPGAPHDHVTITLLPAEIAAAPQFKGTHRPAPVVVARPAASPGPKGSKAPPSGRPGPGGATPLVPPSDQQAAPR